MIKNNNRTINLLLILWMIVIVILSIIPMNQETKIEIGGTPFRLDYLEHFGVFFILGFLYVLSSKKDLPKYINKISILIIYAVITEIIQLFIPGRTFNPWDLIYNILGLVVGYILINQIIKNKVRREYVR